MAVTLHYLAAQVLEFRPSVTLTSAPPPRPLSLPPAGQTLWSLPPAARPGPQTKKTWTLLTRPSGTVSLSPWSLKQPDWPLVAASRHQEIKPGCRVQPPPQPNNRTGFHSPLTSTSTNSRVRISSLSTSPTTHHSIISTSRQHFLQSPTSERDASQKRRPICARLLLPQDPGQCCVRSPSPWLQPPRTSQPGSAGSTVWARTENLIGPRQKSEGLSSGTP